MPYLMPKKLSIITEWDNLRIKRKLIPLWRPRLIKAVEDYVFLGRIIPRTPGREKASAPKILLSQ